MKEHDVSWDKEWEMLLVWGVPISSDFKSRSKSPGAKCFKQIRSVTRGSQLVSPRSQTWIHFFLRTLSFGNKKKLQSLSRPELRLQEAIWQCGMLMLTELDNSIIPGLVYPLKEQTTPCKKLQTAQSALCSAQTDDVGSQPMTQYYSAYVGQIWVCVTCLHSGLPAPSF